MELHDTSVLWEETVPGGGTWSHVLKRGTALRLTDIEGGANAGDRVVVARVGRLASQLGGRQRALSLVQGHGELLLRRTEPVRGMLAAEREEALHVHARAGRDEGVEAACREARRA